MGNPVLKSNKLQYYLILGVFSLLITIYGASAYEFKVGGSNGWRVPTDSDPINYHQWAEKNRFQIGDTLLFTYEGSKDSVLFVSKDDYDNCSTSNPIDKFTNGYSVFKFNHSGPHYFISGTKDNCLRNEKTLIIVLADRTNRSSSSSSPSPAPSELIEPPSSSPPTGSTEMSPPSPAPTGEEAPSPPPTGSVEINPSPAPSTITPEDHLPQDHLPQNNSASSIIGSSVGAFICSYVVFSAL